MCVYVENDMTNNWTSLNGIVASYEYINTIHKNNDVETISLHEV